MKQIFKKQIFKSALNISLLLSCTTTLADSCNTPCSNSCDSYCGPRTSLLLRSQGANTARELVGWQYEINRPYMCENYTSSYLAVEYSRTFKASALANSLFGTDELIFTGSQVSNRSAGDLVADNFGLARNYIGTLTLSPLVQNIIVDFGFYAAFDRCLKGLYFRTHLPFAYSTWNIVGDAQSDFISETTGSATFDAGYMSSAAAKTALGLKQALSGEFQFGDMKYPWTAGQFSFVDQSVGGLADIDLILGYNFFNTDCARFGLYLQGVIPTGNRPNAYKVFQPVIGNGKHFEFGGGLSLMARLWNCENSSLAIFIEGNVTHMFNDTQCRLFDFNDKEKFGGSMSRYLLLKGYTTTVQNPFVYNNELQSAVNILTRNVNVRVDVKGDASLKFSYTHCGFGLDVGYNVYGQSQETITLCNSNRKNDCSSCVESNAKSIYWGIKGTEDVFSNSFQIARPTNSGAASDAIYPNGTTSATFVARTANCPALLNPLKSTEVVNNNDQPLSTICNITPNACYTLGATDCNAILNSTNSAQINALPLNTATLVSNLTAANGYCLVNPTTSPTKIIQEDDSYLNICSAQAPAILTQKVFVHLNHSWENDCGNNPYLGIGAEAEFTPCSNNNNDCNGCDTNSSCRTNYNVWGVWLKGGLSF